MPAEVVRLLVCQRGQQLDHGREVDDVALLLEAALSLAGSASSGVRDSDQRTGRLNGVDSSSRRGRIFDSAGDELLSVNATTRSSSCIPSGRRAARRPARRAATAGGGRSLGHEARDLGQAQPRLQGELGLVVEVDTSRL